MSILLFTLPACINYHYSVDFDSIHAVHGPLCSLPAHLGVIVDALLP